MPSAISKALKYTGITLGLLILLIIIIPFVVDLNDYKPQISQAAKEATGRDLTIEGDIRLSLFPWIGMKLGAVQLSNAEGFGDQPFARIEGAEVKLKLLPLLKREVEMKTIVLQGLRLNLSVAEDGRNNWSDLAKGGGEAAAADAETAPDTAPALASLAIGGLAVTDAQVVYDNRASGARYAIEQLNLTTGPVAYDAPLDITLDSRLSSSKPNVSGALAIQTRLIADMKKFEQHRLENLRLTLDFDSPELKMAGKLSLDGSIDLDLPGQRYSLSPFALNADLKGEGLPGGKANLQLNADISANLQEQLAHINNLKINAYGVAIEGVMSAAQLLETPLLNGELRVAEFSPRTLFSQMGMEAPVTADPKALTRAALELKLVDTTPASIHIKPLTLKLDESTLQGTIGVELREGDALPAVRYQLGLDAIDADRYLAPASEAAPPPAAGGAGAAAAQLPMELLRGLDIDGTANIGKLKISKLHLDEIRTTVKAREGLIRLAPVSARLYQGSYDGDTTLDARGETPRFILKESLRNIQAGPLLKDFMDDDLVSGKGSLNLNLTASGHAADEITRTLNGTIDLNFANIAMKGLNIAGKVRETKARIKGEQVAAEAQRPTDLSEVKGTFLVKNGVVSGNDLSAKAPFARVNGAGNIDLVQTSLDYMVKAKITASTKGEGGAEFDALKGLTVPVRITGPFTAPKFDLQYDEILKERLAQGKAELKAKLDEEKAKLKAEADAKLQAEKEAARKKLDAEKQHLQQQRDQKLQEQKLKAEEAAKEKLKGLLGQ